MCASRSSADAYGRPPDHRESRWATQEDDLAVSARKAFQLKGTWPIKPGRRLAEMVLCVA